MKTTKRKLEQNAIKKEEWRLKVKEGEENASKGKGEHGVNDTKEREEIKEFRMNFKIQTNIFLTTFWIL